MTREGYTGLSIKREWLDRLWEIAPKFGLSVLRPTDKRRRESDALIVERAIEHVLKCLPRRVPTIEEAEERALKRELEQVRP